MKKKEFKEYLKNEIVSILDEASSEDVQTQKDLNKELEKTAELSKGLFEADPEDIKAQDDLNTSLEKTKGLAGDLGDSLSETLNPEVTKAVDRFIKAMAKRYGYGEQDAVFAIQAALKQREFDKPADIPGFEGTRDALDSLSIREEEDDEPSTKDIKSSSKDSVSKIANKLGEITNQMKSVVKKYKDAEEPEKSKMLVRLKELTKIKKELEGLL